MRDGDDVVEFGELFDHQDDLLAELAAQKGETDVVVVLVTVANDEAVGALVHGQGDHQLGLRARFQAVVELFAGCYDLVDDLAQLVDLDGEDAAVGAFVALLLNGLAKDLVQLGDPVAEKVLEADDQRCLEAHAHGLVDHVKSADPATVGERLDVEESRVVN